MYMQQLHFKVKEWADCVNVELNTVFLDELALYWLKPIIKTDSSTSAYFQDKTQQASSVLGADRLVMMLNIWCLSFQKIFFPHKGYILMKHSLSCH